MKNKIIILLAIAAALIGLVVGVSMKKEEFTITFNSNGGTNIEDQIVKKGDKVKRPEDPEKTDNKFLGWYYLDEEYNFNTKVKKDMVLKAKWSEIKKFSVTFDTDGGSLIDTLTVNENTKIDKPANPTKRGYSFVTWYHNNVEYDFSSLIKEDITLKAIWKKNADNVNTIAINEYEKLADIFKSTYNALLSKDIYTITLADEIKVMEAINSYNNSSNEIKAYLTDEIDLLYNLMNRINELKYIADDNFIKDLTELLNILDKEYQTMDDAIHAIKSVVPYKTYGDIEITFEVDTTIAKFKTHDGTLITLPFTNIVNANKYWDDYHVKSYETDANLLDASYLTYDEAEDAIRALAPNGTYTNNFINWTNMKAVVTAHDATTFTFIFTDILEAKLEMDDALVKDLNKEETLSAVYVNRNEVETLIKDTAIFGTYNVKTFSWELMKLTILDNEGNDIVFDFENIVEVKTWMESDDLSVRAKTTDDIFLNTTYATTLLAEEAIKALALNNTYANITINWRLMTAELTGHDGNSIVFFFTDITEIKDKMTADDLAVASKVSDLTFLNQFTTKEDALSAVLALATNGTYEYFTIDFNDENKLLVPTHTGSTLEFVFPNLSDI